MKKLILLTLCVISLPVFAQEAKSITINERKDEHITAQKMRVDEKTGNVTLTQNVKIKLDRLSLEADSVVYFVDEKSFVAYKYKEFAFKGELVINEKPKSIVRYKLGSPTIFID